VLATRGASQLTVAEVTDDGNTATNAAAGASGTNSQQQRMLVSQGPWQSRRRSGGGIGARLIVFGMDGLGRCGAAPEVILGPLEKTSQKRLSRALILNAAYA
jgi:hypothetical protein